MNNRLLTVTDLNGNTEALANYKDFRIRGKVNGERLLSLFLMPNKLNEHSWPLVKEESIIEYNGQKYRIKKPSERSRGSKTVKIIQAHHIMFDLIDDWQYDVLDAGNKSILAAIQHTLDGTGFTYEIIDSFSSVHFENFGDDNRLSLLQTIMNRYKAEFDVNNKHITIKKQIGNKTDFQFRFKHNIKTIQKDIDTSNLTTYIKGYGADGLVVEYTSPNASIFGIRHARPVRDERYTTESGLLERLKEEINDEPYFSVTLTFAELKKSGYPYEVVELGDETHLIYEPMDDLMMKVRVMEYNEFPEEPIESTVTLGNYKKNAARSQADLQATRNQIERSFVEGRLKSSAMELAVQRASEALNNALTELEFPKDYGIIARNPNNANHFLALNSNGLGITLDGGQTFQEAITTDGFVLSAGVVGTMLFNYLRGGELVLGGSNNENGVMQVYNSNGDVIADLNGDRGGFSDLYVSKLDSPNVVLKQQQNITLRVSSYTVNDGYPPDDSNGGTSWNDALRTVGEALRRIPKYLDGITVNIVLAVNSQFNENVNISGFVGNGLIVIDGQTTSLSSSTPQIKGRTLVTDCSCRVSLKNTKFVNGGEYYVVNVRNCGYVYMEWSGIYGYTTNKSTSGIYIVDGSTVYVAYTGFYNISDRAINATNGSIVKVYENVGTVDNVVYYANASIIAGGGTIPSGAVNKATSFGGQIFGIPDTPTEDSGSGDGGTTAQETTQSWNATSSANWRENYGGQWNANNYNPYQGEWDGWGRYRGYWFFGTAVRTAVMGKIIKQIRVKLTRQNNGGYSSSVNAIIRAHGYDSAPTSNNNPTYVGGLSGTYHAVGFKWGESKWVTLPSSFHSMFESGDAYGIGIYTSSTANSNYMIFSGSAEIEITYE